MRQYNVSYENYKSVGVLAVITIGDISADSPTAAVATATMVLPSLVRDIGDWDYVRVVTKGE